MPLASPRRALFLGVVAAAVVGHSARAADLPVVDDWRAAGPPDLGERPSARGLLSTAAAEKLVAAIDEAWRRPEPQRPRSDGRTWIVENLRYAFFGADGRSMPRAMGPVETQKERRELLRRVELLGVRPAGAHRLLLAVIHTAYDESGDDYGAAALAVVVAPDGRVTDAAALAYGWGDACYADARTLRIGAAALQVRDLTQIEGLLCQEPGDPSDECCSVVEGSSFDLEVGRDGRFAEKKRSRLNLSGQFEDPKTAEELRIEQSVRDVLRLGYRSKAGLPWKPMQIVSADRERGVIVAKFEKSPVKYALTLAADGRSLASAGSDGTRPQQFAWIPTSERWKREPKR